MQEKKKIVVFLCFSLQVLLCLFYDRQTPWSQTPLDISKKIIALCDLPHFGWPPTSTHHPKFAKKKNKKIYIQKKNIEILYLSHQNTKKYQHHPKTPPKKHDQTIQDLHKDHVKPFFEKKNIFIKKKKKLPPMSPQTLHLTSYVPNSRRTVWRLRQAASCSLRPRVAAWYKEPIWNVLFLMLVCFGDLCFFFGSFWCVVFLWFVLVFGDLCCFTFCLLGSWLLSFKCLYFVCGVLFLEE